MRSRHFLFACETGNQRILREEISKWIANPQVTEETIRVFSLGYVIADYFKHIQIIHQIFGFNMMNNLIFSKKDCFTNWNMFGIIHEDLPAMDILKDDWEIPMDFSDWATPPDF